MSDPIPMFNGREEAIGAWLVLAVAWMLTQPELRSSLATTLSAVSRPKLLAAACMAAIYSGGVVATLAFVEAWETWQARETVYWFLGTALVLKVRTIGKDERFFGRVVRDVLAVGFVLQFVAALYTFPFYVEIWLVPLLFFAGGALGLRDERYKPLRQTAEVVVIGLALILVSFSLVHVVRNLDAFASLDTLRAFLLAPVLTVAFVPFLYGFALVAAYELVFMRLGFALRNKPWRDAKWRLRIAILRVCGLRLSAVNRFSPATMPELFAAESVEQAQGAVEGFGRRGKASSGSPAHGVSG